MGRIMKHILTILFCSCFILTGCVTNSNEVTTKDVIDIVSKAPPHPVEPDWQVYTRKPVLRSFTHDDQKNYEVSDEFIKRNLQLQDYADRIKAWKRKNLIP